MRLPGQLVEDHRQLKPDQHEEQRVQDEHDDLPHGVTLDACPCRRELGRMRAHVDADGDGREHCRRVDQLGRDVGEVRAEQGDRDLERRVVEPATHLPDDPADGEADGDAGNDAVDELEPCVPDGEAAAHDGDDRESIGDQCGSVVDEALAFDDRDQPARNPEPARDRCRGNRIGRGDDGPQHERSAPGEVVDRRVGDRCNGDGGGDHEPDTEQADRSHVHLQLVQGGEEGARVEQGWENGDQHEIGRKLELGHAGNEADGEPAEHEHDRVRHAQRRRDHEHGRDGHEQDEEDDQLLVRQLHDETLRRRFAARL